MKFSHDAQAAAEYATGKLYQQHRGAIKWRASGVSAVFGNDAYRGSDDRARLEVDIFRQSLSDLGIEERGFGLSLDGYTWAMLVGSEDLPLLKRLVVDAWRIACGQKEGDPEWESFKKVNGLD